MRCFSVLYFVMLFEKQTKQQQEYTLQSRRIPPTKKEFIIYVHIYICPRATTKCVCMYICVYLYTAKINIQL